MADGTTKLQIKCSIQNSIDSRVWQCTWRSWKEKHCKNKNEDENNRLNKSKCFCFYQKYSQDVNIWISKIEP